jgi:hypothetical protein
MPKIVKKRLADGTIKTYRYDGDPKARTIGALVIEYQRSGDYKRLAASSKRQRQHYMGHIVDAYRDTAVAAIKRRHVMQSVDVPTATHPARPTRCCLAGAS